MMDGRLRCPRALVLLALFVTLVCGIGNTQGGTASSGANTAERLAQALYEQGKFVDALPLFANLSADHPSDKVLKERWAWCLFQYATTLSDPEQRKKTLTKAHAVALEANKLGDNSQLLMMLLQLPVDGSEKEYSTKKEVNEILKAAEADFVRGDLDKAKAGYLRALALDPTNYDAALFTGDVFFKQHSYANAGE